MAARVLSGGSQRSKIKEHRLDTADTGTRASGVTSLVMSGVHYPSREDEYGIPLMELSSDSDVS